MFLTPVTAIAIAVYMLAGDLLRAWRDGRGLSQQEAAELLGVSQASVSDYERGVKSPDVDRALRIAETTDGSVPVESWRKPDESPHVAAADAIKTG
jgi:transcriptional regulator with XRE-family HTH domain